MSHYTDCENSKQLKYITWNGLSPYPCDVKATCEPGFQYIDGFGVGGCAVDIESKLKISHGNINTNLRTIQNLQERQFTANPDKGRGCGHIPTETKLKYGLHQDKSKPCLGSIEFFSLPYHMQILNGFGGNNSCYNPQWAESQSFVPSKIGVDTRSDLREQYRLNVGRK